METFPLCQMPGYASKLTQSMHDITNDKLIIRMQNIDKKGRLSLQFKYFNPKSIFNHFHSSHFHIKMFKFLALVALCATAVSGSAIISPATIVKKGVADVANVRGVVSPVGRCGGVGTPLQLRISDCEGYCELRPGTVYNCEEDFMPSSAAPSLTLKIEVCMNAGFCMQILETELANSSVQPGFIYTAKYSIVPNDILSGQTVEFRAYISHTNTGLLEICVSANIDITFGVGR